jgi:Mg2+-importing ATPase
MIYVGPISSIFDYATFFLMLYFYHCSVVQNEGDASTMHYQQLFQTAWFVESILTQTMIVHIIRTRRIPFFQSSPSAFLLCTTIVIMGIGGWLPYSPFAAHLGMVPLPASFWLFVTVFVLLYSVLTHNVKVWYFNKFGID